MKKEFTKYISWRNVISVLIIGVFVLMGIGSLQFTTNELLPDGRVKETFADIVLNKKRTVTGKKDKEGRWAGKVEIEYVSNATYYREEAYMAYGMRQGISTREYKDGRKVSNYYVNDVAVDIEKSAKTEVIPGVAYQLLDKRYPWYLFEMNACDFDSAYIESFIDTVETILFAGDFMIGDFSDVYGDVQDSLMNSRYADIIDLNSRISSVEGFQKMKNAEIRLAVLNRYWTNAATTFGVVKTVYPGYLQAMNDSGFVNDDFELFCHKLDSCLDSYSPLAIGDAFFTDSIDSRLYRALYFIAGDTKSARSDLSALLFEKSISLSSNRLIKMFEKFARENANESSPAEVSVMVINDILARFYAKADIFKEVFYQTALVKNNSIVVPEIATTVIDESSETSIKIRGDVLSDGGSGINQEGIVWATHYNPTIDDSKLPAVGLLPEFELNLSGLTPGKTYYIRTYAANSKGLSYGNCVEFVAGSKVVVDAISNNQDRLSVFPNPVLNDLMIQFKPNSERSLTIGLYNLNGSLIIQKNFKIDQQDVFRTQIDIAALADGPYYLLLLNGQEKFVKKIKKIH